MKHPALLIVLFLALFGAFSAGLKIRLMEVPENPNQLQVGAEAPNFVLERLDGSQIDLSEVVRENRVVVVNFWATWCGPCKIEMPQFERLFAERGAEGLEFLAITVESREVVEAFLQDKPFSFQILLDPDGVITERYGIEAFPTTIILDEDGRVTRSTRGLDSRLEQEITRILQSPPAGSQNSGDDGG